MAPASPGAMPATIGLTRFGSPMLTEGEGAGGGGGAGSGSGDGGKGDEIDAEAAKAAIEIVGKMKAAGVEDPSSVLDLVKNLRDFEKGNKLPKKVKDQLDDLTAKAKAAEDAKLTEVEQLQKQLNELTEKLDTAGNKGRTRGAKAALLAAATKAGAVYPDDIQNRSDLLEKVEYDDDGDPTNVEQLVTDLKKDRPALFNARAGTFDGGARGGAKGPADMNDVLRERMRR